MESGTAWAVKWFSLKKSLELSANLYDVFPYFAEASNLETITPPWLQFKILTPKPINMAIGARIDYRLHIHGFPLRWQSEITEWNPPFGFTDEQRMGPYRRWIHRHRFHETNAGCLVEDEIEYAVWGGSLINSLMVQKDLTKIFDYRHRIIKEKFRTPEHAPQ